MDDRPDNPHLWHDVLAVYEQDTSNWDQGWDALLANYAELTRELLKCRGIGRLFPYSSMMRLCVGTGPHSLSPLSVSLVVEQHPAGRFRVCLTRQTLDRGEWDSRTLLDRTCPHVRSAVRAIRVAARLMGVKISQPPREQPPAGATRRQWLVISKYGLFAPPRPRVYRELRLDGFAFDTDS